MRKLFICCLAMFFFIGCAQKKDESAELITYMVYEKAIHEYEKFNEKSDFYSISAEMITLPDKTYRYYIFIDNAQVAMYDIKILAVEDGKNLSTSGKMMPSIGIFDKQEYSMLPYQSYIEKGFVKGLMLSGETTDSSILLKMIVEWKDKSLEKTNREYISVNLALDGIHYTEAETGK